MAKRGKGLSPYQRSLLRYTSRALWGWALVGVVGLAGCAWLAVRQLYGPFPALADVEGTVQAVRAQRGKMLDFTLVERGERFRVSPYLHHEHLARAYKARLLARTHVTLQVDAAELRAPSRPLIDGIPTVSVLGIRSSDTVWFRPADVERWRAEQRAGTPYVFAAVSLAPLLLMLLAWQRSKLNGREDEVISAAPEPDSKPLVGRKGPFAMHPSFGRLEKITLALLAVVNLPTGVFLMLVGSGETRSVVSFGTGLVLLLSFPVAIIVTRRRLDESLELARSGRIIHADLVSLVQTHGQHAELLLVYRLPQGREVKESFRIDRPPPLLEDNKVFALCSYDERHSKALRSDGYPIALG